MSAPTKVLRRDVDRAHDAWANACCAWGPDNLARVAPTIRYYELRDQYEQQTGRPYTRGNRR